MFTCSKPSWQIIEQYKIIQNITSKYFNIYWLNIFCIMKLIILEMKTVFSLLVAILIILASFYTVIHFKYEKNIFWWYFCVWLKTYNLVVSISQVHWFCLFVFWLQFSHLLTPGFSTSLPLIALLVSALTG